MKKLLTILMALSLAITLLACKKTDIKDDLSKTIEVEDMEEPREVEGESLAKIYPKRLKLGDTIAIVAPAGPLDKARVEEGVKVLETMGFKVKLGKNLYKTDRYLASSDLDRAEDLMDMFRDEEVDGIISTRGGYGSPRILDKLDYQLIKENPKILLGYSDITALLNAIYKKTGLISFHGPMIKDEIGPGMNKIVEKYFRKLLMEDSQGLVYENPKDRELKILVEGKGQGELVGGNLSMIISSLASPYQIDFKDKVLFIEETNEHIYKIDRMFNQLRLAGAFEELQGIILGDFNSIDEKGLGLLFEEYFRHLDIPVIYNFSAGHTRDNICLPIGSEIKIDRGSIEIVDGATN